jgi:hypothetical protein
MFRLFRFSSPVSWRAIFHMSLAAELQESSSVVEEEVHVEYENSFVV